MVVTNIIRRNMSHNVVAKLINNAETAEKKLAELRSKVIKDLDEIKRFKLEEKIRDLSKENDILAIKVENAKAELIRLETLKGIKQYSIPGKTTSAINNNEAAPIKTEIQEKPVINKKEKKEKDVKKTKEKSSDTNTIDTVDVRKLDFRIGKIIEISKHPDADSLYVEKIDCGEANPRTVVSGLVNHVPIDQMRDKIVMVLCNLKPVKMRGVTSEAMVMCASSPEKVEVLIPPSEAVPGDLVSCEGYPREPEAQLNPKKKIFETCAPDLKTNDEKVACYKGNPLVIPGKGPVVAPSLKGVNVK
ncbi:aminoacyl tRNA synthase complex-interacting multifunctional protein 1 isoform X1 [Ostrinia furnacalis]|uniref:aminoacyl tRNA synthase complex-interacting multifunctional protein 1 isoform X1 n=1 Tax=Ostrinia furnacalis TaxID=93504 RepID=UPI00103FCA45|nr:aminoacyl tRNA synthase complex-interacting multifunctional protein 1 isoform X1 [Ostrinia furnacalis]